jgi:predicted metal-dependent HD superfamily phosphohydrolase
MADRSLASAGVDGETRARVARLIAGHEHPPTPDDPDAADLALLNDADALSFLSLNSPGYVDWFGPDAARRKVAWTLARLRPEARRRLDGVRLRPDVAEMVT